MQVLNQSTNVAAEDVGKEQDTGVEPKSYMPVEAVVDEVTENNDESGSANAVVGSEALESGDIPQPVQISTTRSMSKLRRLLLEDPDIVSDWGVLSPKILFTDAGMEHSDLHTGSMPGVPRPE